MDDWRGSMIERQCDGQIDRQTVGGAVRDFGQRKYLISYGKSTDAIKFYFQHILK